MIRTGPFDKFAIAWRRASIRVRFATATTATASTLVAITRGSLTASAGGVSTITMSTDRPISLIRSRKRSVLNKSAGLGGTGPLVITARLVRTSRIATQFHG